MSNFILPESVAAQLAGQDHMVNLCDATGKRLGYFVPIAIDDLDPGLSNEELRKIEQSSEWYSTKQVLKHLENLG